MTSLILNDIEEEYFSRISPYYVIGVSDRVEVKNLKGNSWLVPKDVFLNECYGTKTSNTITLSRTQLVENVFLRTKDKIFEVTFLKKPKAGETVGEERVLVGYRKPGSFNGNILGRSDVYELVHKDGVFKRQVRQVDHRTIKSLKFAGTEYIVGRGSNDALPKPTKVKENELTAQTFVVRISYMRKISSSGDSTTVENLSGKRWPISNAILEDDCDSVKETGDPEKSGITKMAEVLVNSGDTITKTVFKKSDGSLRTMVSHHTHTETCFGRSKVMELTVKDDKLIEQQREINHREIEKIVFKGNIYVSGKAKRSRTR